MQNRTHKLGLLIFSLVLPLRLLGVEISGEISGNVYDAKTREGIFSATVTLEAPGLSPKSTITGSDGDFSFRDLEPAEYTLKIESDDFDFYKTIKIKVDQPHLQLPLELDEDRFRADLDSYLYDDEPNPLLTARSTEAGAEFDLDNFLLLGDATSTETLGCMPLFYVGLVATELLADQFAEPLLPQVTTLNERQYCVVTSPGSAAAIGADALLGILGSTYHTPDVNSVAPGSYPPPGQLMIDYDFQNSIPLPGVGPDLDIPEREVGSSRQYVVTVFDTNTEPKTAYTALLEERVLSILEENGVATRETVQTLQYDFGSRGVAGVQINTETRSSAPAFSLGFYRQLSRSENRLDTLNGATTRVSNEFFEFSNPPLDGIDGRRYRAGMVTFAAGGPINVTRDGVASTATAWPQFTLTVGGVEVTINGNVYDVLKQITVSSEGNISESWFDRISGWLVLRADYVQTQEVTQQSDGGDERVLVNKDVELIRWQITE